MMTTMKTELTTGRTNAGAQRTQSSAEAGGKNFETAANVAALEFGAPASGTARSCEFPNAPCRRPALRFLLRPRFLRISPRPLRLCVSPLLAALLLCVFALNPSAWCATTNNLTALLQQGLFEEQANRNLDAAIENYTTLAKQFDQDRQLAATAVFRLGECYRAQGKTNEAAAQYQRILRDFPDQKTLATLSRQDLTGMGFTTPERFQQRLQAVITRAPSDSAALPTDEEDREIRRIQQMIQNSPDLINAPGNNGTPLEQAASAGWLKVATYLLDHGAKVGDVALNNATKVGNRAMVELLLSRGADVNRNFNGLTPLHIAAQNGFQAVAEVLLANKADVNALDSQGNTPLRVAALKGGTKIIKMLLAAAANPNIQNKNGQTPLSAAAGNGSSEITKLLLDAGANPNVENDTGQTPLSFAAGSRSPETVKLLLDAKADPNGGKMNAPLLSAINARDAASAELLLQAGASPNVKGMITFSIPNNSRDVTPLYAAVLTKQFPIVQLLLKYKADPNDAQTDGRAVIFDALTYPDILNALLEAGAKAEVRDETDASQTAGTGSFAFRLQNLTRPDLKRTPLLFAAGEETNFLAVAALLQHGANPNATDGQGDTPLHQAAAGLADEKVFTLLLEHKANPNVRNNDGKTPLDLVKERLRLQVSGSRFPNQDQSGINYGQVSAEQKGQAEKLIALLHQHGALDNLPDWNRITVSRPAANFSATVFQRGTNDWNHFTLLELICRFYGYSRQLSFPDLSRVVVARPGANGAAGKRIEINLLTATNSIDYAKDMPLEFGDVVEIPERGHTLAEQDNWFNGEREKLRWHIRGQAGEVRLAVAGGQTVQVPLKDFEVADGYLGNVLGSPAARNVLTSGSDLARVKVTRRDLKTGKSKEWILDGSNQNNPGTPGLLLRAGDVIEVPEKPQ